MSVLLTSLLALDGLHEIQHVAHKLWRLPSMTRLQHVTCDSAARFLHETISEAIDLDMHGEISCKPRQSYCSYIWIAIYVYGHSYGCILSDLKEFICWVVEPGPQRPKNLPSLPFGLGEFGRWVLSCVLGFGCKVEIRNWFSCWGLNLGGSGKVTDSEAVVVEVVVEVVVVVVTVVVIVVVDLKIFGLLGSWPPYTLVFDHRPHESHLDASLCLQPTYLEFHG